MFACAAANALFYIDFRYHCALGSVNSLNGVYRTMPKASRAVHAFGRRDAAI